MVGWIFATGLLSRPANHGLGAQILVAAHPRQRPFPLLQRQPSDVLPPCCRSRTRRSSRPCRRGSEWEGNRDRRRRTHDECTGMRDPRHLVFRPSLRPPTQASAQVAVGPDHCTSLHGDLTTGSASSSPRQAQLNISGPDHSRTTCHRCGPAIDRPCRYRECTRMCVLCSVAVKAGNPLTGHARSRCAVDRCRLSSLEPVSAMASEVLRCCRPDSWNGGRGRVQILAGWSLPRLQLLTVDGCVVTLDIKRTPRKLFFFGSRNLPSISPDPIPPCHLAHRGVQAPPLQSHLHSPLRTAPISKLVRLVRVWLALFLAPQVRPLRWLSLVAGSRCSRNLPRPR